MVTVAKGRCAMSKHYDRDCPIVQYFEHMGPTCDHDHDSHDETCLGRRAENRYRELVAAHAGLVEALRSAPDAAQVKGLVSLEAFLSHYETWTKRALAALAAAERKEGA